jgi:hypothetical protein
MRPAAADAGSGARRARAASPEAATRIHTRADSAAVHYVRTPLWEELTGLRFLNGTHGALVPGQWESA